MKLAALLIGLVTIAGANACTKSVPTSTTQTTDATPAPTITAKRITTADLQKLKWIEGTWRGTGEVQPPFFERYHFENDSTLVMEELADETLNQVTKTTRYELKENRNSFRWQSESKNLWRAILTLPATATAPAKETVYRMERLN